MSEDQPEGVVSTIDVTEAHVSSREGGKVELEIGLEVPPQLQRPEVLTVELALHDEVSVGFWASVSCQRHYQRWRGQVSPGPSATRRLVEMVRVRTPDGLTARLPTERLFFEPQTGGVWESGDAAEIERVRLSEVRKARFVVPLTAAGSDPNAPEFVVVVLVDNLYLTREQRVPGWEITPLQNATLGADQAQVLNSVMAQLGFSTRVNPTEWVSSMARQRPAAILHAPRVVAPTAEEAHTEARRLAHNLLDLLALRRGATPRLLSGVVGIPAGDGTTTHAGSWIEGPGYTGNLLGGFIAGEDPHSLVTEWDGLHAEPRARLWLSLYADALAEERWDYRLFRCFNLLEGIGREVIPAGQTVRDSQGNVLVQSNGQAYTTSHARGRLYTLLRTVADLFNVAEASYAAPRASGTPVTLWDETAIWVAVRNAVAHRGSWTLADGQLPSPAHVALEAEIASRGHDGTLEVGVLQLVRALREGVEATLRAALRQLL